MTIYTTVFTALIDFTAPTAPDIAEKYIPQEVETFGDGLWYVIKQALLEASPDLSKAAAVCCSLIAIVIILSIIGNLSEASNSPFCLAGVIAASGVMLNSSGTLIALGAETVTQISEYGKLLLPVLCSALAANGGGGSAVALYSGTVIFNTILTTVISKLLIPGIYVYIAVSLANRSVGNATLSDIAKLIKNGITWILKTSLYIFTGYMTVTGVVSGSVDAASIKAAKLAISSSVPVVGGILSDASEAFISGVRIAKNAAGIMGIITILAIWIGPFLKVGIQYLFLKLSGAVCSTLNRSNVSNLIDDISDAMGLLLAATGAIGFIHIFSSVCFIRGVS